LAYLTAWEIQQPGIHKSASSIRRKVENDGKKVPYSEYTHTHMGIHKDRVFPIKLMNAVYLNKQEKISYEKLLTETIEEKLEMRREVCKPLLLINGRIEGFHVRLHYYASHASLKYPTGHRNENNESHYPSDDAENVAADDCAAQAKLA
jgi:hypothetical protein